MNKQDLIKKASEYLHGICSVEPNRRTGSKGNKDACDYFSGIVKALGYAVETEPFNCLDYKAEKALLSCKGKPFPVYVSPYSLGCDIEDELVTVSTVKELEKISCRNKILLMKDEICEEQLMPKNFVFYNPDHHKRVYALLEEKRPAAIITATAKKPEQVGALYPFPLIVDGDFDIPSVYCTDVVGNEIAEKKGTAVELVIQAERIPSSSCNVIARKNREGNAKIVVCAHIDAYEDSPGASDNASGTVVLLLLAELLRDYDGSKCIELIAFNGEDHYSAGGQMDYLGKYGSGIDEIILLINVDDVGYKGGRSAYSFYQCGNDVQNKLRLIFTGYGDIVEGDSWYSGDHMIFVQKGKSALALTSEKMPELMMTVTHTEKDVPDLVDAAKLVGVAGALNEAIRALWGQ